MSKLNVGVGTHTDVLAEPLIFDAVNVDVLRLPGVDVICDVQHLPFRTQIFADTFCYHVLEHTLNPAMGLRELLRVSTRLVELEVPHHLGKMAKSQKWKKGDVSLYHLCSFNCMWFHRSLKNYVRCLKVNYQFPNDLRIHVWVYIAETAARRRFEAS